MKIELTCQQCNQPFHRIPAKASYAKFCSRACRGLAERNRITNQCAECGRDYQKPAHRADETRFCSRSCKAKFTFRENPAPNDHKLGNTFRAGMRPMNAFTSDRVRGDKNARWVKPASFACQQCKATFERKPWEVAQQNGQPLFCSKACHGLFMRENFSGENSPHWVGGITTYRGKGWLEARAKAVARDGGTCQDCGLIVGCSIPVHHIRPFREFTTPQEANSLDNLVCLCQSCHMKREPRKKTLAAVVSQQQ